ncbi:MAG TPA: molybdopterin-dependent oxidoreductase [Anaerolineales bacterium]|nr:molybdopterin-dependent oxidoreductase [Anaerolineales bacterium]
MNGASLRFINTLILILFCILGVTGLYGLVWPFPAFLYEVHRAAGWALILLIPWKTIISLRSLRLRLDLRFDRNVMIVVSLLLAAATLVVLILGVKWAWNLGEYYVWIGPYAYSGIGWHWGIALGLAPLFIIHVWRRWPRPKQTDFAGRRQALKLIGLGLASVTSWGAAEALSRALQHDDSPRRFTGSREKGSFTGLDYPVTSGADQGKIRLTPETWKLSVKGAVESPFTLNYADALALSVSEMTVILDCTGGWYTTQVWRGIRLADLLAQAGIQQEKFTIALRDVSGYTAHFTPAEASEILLATQSGGQILDHWHGYPLRAVVPSRRGWHWVKWLTEVEVIAA